MALGWLWWHARFPRARVVAAAAAFCVAGVALGDTHLRFTWQAWHLVTSTFVSCGRPGTRLTHFAWQPWHVWHWASGRQLSVPTCPSGRHGFLHGRRGTWRHSSSFHVAGVVLGDIHLRFTWHLTYSHTTCSHTTYSHATYSRTTCTHTTYSRRRRTWRYGSSLCVAGVARMALGWLWWRARFSAVAVVAAAFCVTGVALRDM